MLAGQTLSAAWEEDHGDDADDDDDADADADDDDEDDDVGAEEEQDDDGENRLMMKAVVTHSEQIFQPSVLAQVPAQTPEESTTWRNRMWNS